METNFESTYSQKQNTIRKATYVKKADLQASTRHEEKQEKRQTTQDLYRKGDVRLPKQPWPALILHNTQNVQREQNTVEQAKEYSLPLQRAVRGFHHQQ